MCFQAWAISQNLTWDFWARQLKRVADGLRQSSLLLVGVTEKAVVEPVIRAAEAITTSVDSLGVSLLLKTNERNQGGGPYRLPPEVATALETRKVLVEMVQQARQ
jgi:hypothetical protein